MIAFRVGKNRKTYIFFTESDYQFNNGINRSIIDKIDMYGYLALLLINLKLFSLDSAVQAEQCFQGSSIEEEKQKYSFFLLTDSSLRQATSCQHSIPVAFHWRKLPTIIALIYHIKSNTDICMFTTAIFPVLPV